ncbi:MAG: VWA domain-containing protein [Robiginitomaculum sp.]|nr:VWA domain-containing protein [Robiginitomaculum sp.]
MADKNKKTIACFRISLRKFFEDTSGSTAMLFAIVLLAVVTLTGVAYDFSRSQSAKTSLQNAADAAALAIARDPDTNLQNLTTRATDFFNANMQGQSFGFDHRITATELEGGIGVRVEVSTEIETTFAGLAGFDTIEVKTVAEVLYSASKVELVLALDNTGSMGWNGKIGTLREAASDLVEKLLPPGSAEENVKIGVVPFNYMVRLPTSYKNENWMKFNLVSANSWHGCIAPRKPPHDTRDSNPNTNAKKFTALPGNGCPEQALTPLTNDRQLLLETIDEMEAQNWTYVPEGLAWAWRVLSKKKPLREGVPYNDEDWTKIIVLMTDGANTVEWEWPNNIPDETTGTSSNQGDNATEILCQRIKNKDIYIYTIAFEVNNNSTEQMLEDCATEPDMYFDAQNQAQLVSAFAKIAGDITNLRLSR